MGMRDRPDKSSNPVTPTFSERSPSARCSKASALGFVPLLTSTRVQSAPDLEQGIFALLT
jgi:hypothetical protein